MLVSYYAGVMEGIASGGPPPQEKKRREEKNRKMEKDKNWTKQQAESVGLILEDSDSEEERVDKSKQRKAVSMRLKKLKEELNMLLSRPLQPKSFSHRFLAGAGVSPVLQHQLEQLAQQKLGSDENNGESKRKLAVIGQDCVEPLQALRKAGPEMQLDVKSLAEKQRNMENLRRKRREAKKRQKEQKRKQRKSLKEAASA